MILLKKLPNILWFYSVCKILIKWNYLKVEYFIQQIVNNALLIYKF